MQHDYLRDPEMRAEQEAMSQPATVQSEGLKEIQDRVDRAIQPSGKGEQHCGICGRMSYVGDPKDVEHYRHCATHDVRFLLTIVAANSTRHALALDLDLDENNEARGAGPRQATSPLVHFDDLDAVALRCVASDLRREVIDANLRLNDLGVPLASEHGEVYSLTGRINALFAMLRDISQHMLKERANP